MDAASNIVYDPLVNGLYIFDKGNREIVHFGLGDTAHSSKEEPLELKSATHPICFCERRAAIESHRHGLLCWSLSHATKDVSVDLVHVWPVGTHMSTSSSTLIKASQLVGDDMSQHSAACTTLGTLKAVHNVGQDKYILDTAGGLLFIDASHEVPRTMNVLLGSLFDSEQMPHALRAGARLVAMRSTENTHVHLAVFYVPQVPPNSKTLAAEVRGSLIVCEVEIVVEQSGDCSLSLHNKFGAEIGPYPFSSHTKVSTERVPNAYVVTVADATTLRVHEVSRSHAHAHTNGQREPDEVLGGGVLRKAFPIVGLIPGSVGIRPTHVASPKDKMHLSADHHGYDINFYTSSADRGHVLHTIARTESGFDVRRIGMSSDTEVDMEE
jgi:hypothetical protein